jgi:NADH pyrophosphatase NudC (nudix superfamily)
MPRLRRKPRYCRQCGQPLRTPKTGLWFFCSEPCQAAYIETHEPDTDPAHLLDVRPSDEDNEGQVNPPAPIEEVE